MDSVLIKEKKLVGLRLPFLTTNDNSQASIDCGNLWQQFEKENCFSKIANKISNEIFAVYHNYESDENGKYGYFIGCEVEEITDIPDGFGSLIIPGSTYIPFLAKGVMPNCIADCWKQIWSTKLPRKYSFDFEVYGEKVADWNNAEIDVFIAVQ